MNAIEDSQLSDAIRASLLEQSSMIDQSNIESHNDQDDNNDEILSMIDQLVSGTQENEKEEDLDYEIIGAEEDLKMATPKPTFAKKLKGAKLAHFTEIQNLGYEKQNEELMELGFCKLRKNLKYLTRYQGNVDLIVQAFIDKIIKKEERKKWKEQKNKNFKYQDDSNGNSFNHKPHKYRKFEEGEGKFGGGKRDFSHKYKDGDRKFDKFGDGGKFHHKNNKYDNEKGDDDRFSHKKNKFDRKFDRSRERKHDDSSKFNKEPGLQIHDIFSLKNKEKQFKDGSKGKDKVACQKYDSLPSHINTMYLDGNNMIFEEDGIRQYALKRQKRQAEIILSNICENYIKSHPTGVHVVLVFDRTGLNITKEVVRNGQKFTLRVLSSGRYGNSDDAMVDWAGQIGPNAAKKCLFVTGDRELQSRLQAKGGQDIMKPRKWFRMMEASIGSQNYWKIIKEN